MSKNEGNVDEELLDALKDWNSDHENANCVIVGGDSFEE